MIGRLQRPLVPVLILLLVAFAQASAASGPIQPLAGAQTHSTQQTDSKGRLHGTLTVRHGDDFKRGRETAPEYFLASGDNETKLVFKDKAPEKLVGAHVRVRGRVAADGEAFRVAAGGVAVESAATGSTTAATTSAGTHRVAVVLLNFSNDTSQPYTPEVARGVAFTNTTSVAAYYAANSWGQLTLSGDVYGWVTISNTNANCAYSTWATAANAAAGIDTSNYDNIVYAFPQTSCGWAGLATMPGKTSWLNGPMAMSLRVMAHELGHNFGTHHAGEYKCTQGGVRVPLSANAANCTTGEYGDPFSVMGGAARYEHTNFARGNFGWLVSSNTQVVTAAGDYLLAPVEWQVGVTALRVARTVAQYFTLEFRQPDGTPFDNFSATSALANGVVIRLTASSYTSRTQTWMVWAHPSATYCECHAALMAGETLSDPLSGVTFSVASVSPAGALVHVSFAGSREPTPTAGVTPTPTVQPTATPAPTSTPAPTPTVTPAPTPAPTASPTAPTDVQPPSAPSNLRASVAKGRKVVLSWDTSADNVGVAGYHIFRNGARVADATEPTYTDPPSGKKGATVTYYVVAFDAAGNASQSSNSVTLQR